MHVIERFWSDAQNGVSLQRVTYVGELQPAGHVLACRLEAHVDAVGELAVIPCLVEDGLSGLAEAIVGGMADFVSSVAFGKIARFCDARGHYRAE